MSINLRLMLLCGIFGILTLLVGIVGERTHDRINVRFNQDYAAVLASASNLEAARNEAALTEAHFSQMQGSEAALDTADRGLLAAAVGRMLAEVRASLPTVRAPEAQRATEAVVYDLVGLQGTRGDMTRRSLLAQLAKLEIALDAAIGASREDASRLAGEVTGLIALAARSNLAGLVCSFLGLAAVAFWISRSLVEPVRRATAAIGTMATGKPAGKETPAGARELMALQRALKDLGSWVSTQSELQRRSILMQATTLGSALTAKENQFLAAMNNMPQGLCMLDPERNLVVFNEPFAQLFEHLRHGACAATILADPTFQLFLEPHETGVFLHEMPNGEIFQVKRRGVGGGGLVITFENVTVQHRFAQRLEHLAGHDALTGLANRRQFSTALQEMLTGESGFGDIAVFYIDLGSFKLINDSFGHPAGDGLLQAVAARLSACAGPRDVVARLGGDEFAIIQEAGAQPAAATALAERLLQAFLQSFPIEARPVQISASIGIVSVSNKDAEAARLPDAVMQSCNLALYAAKRQTGSAYRFYVAEMREDLRIRHAFEDDLRLALVNGELDLVYEPFVDSDRCQISGFEVLLRWKHPLRGFVSPANFIPVAEELGLIDEFGLWALRTACGQAAGWPEELMLSVNLSAAQFRSGTLVADVAAALADSRLAPGRLQLEVTESLFLSPAPEILEMLTALRKLGVRIAMDDFGTGYSSLGYLTRFPFDKIKIDQSFVRDIDRPESRAVVSAVLGISRALNIAVIAEGVETVEQYRLLQEEGCSHMQGYLFSRPRPAGELPLLLLAVSQQMQRLQGEVPGAPAERRLAGDGLR